LDLVKGKTIKEQLYEAIATMEEFGVSYPMMRDTIDEMVSKNGLSQAYIRKLLPKALKYRQRTNRRYIRSKKR
jgi:hypothetical protein